MSSLNANSQRPEDVTAAVPMSAGVGFILRKKREQPARTNIDDMGILYSSKPKFSPVVHQVFPAAEMPAQTPAPATPDYLVAFAKQTPISASHLRLPKLAFKALPGLHSSRITICNLARLLMDYGPEEAKNLYAVCRVVEDEDFSEMVMTVIENRMAAAHESSVLDWTTTNKTDQLMTATDIEDWLLDCYKSAHPITGRVAAKPIPRLLNRLLGRV